MHQEDVVVDAERDQEHEPEDGHGVVQPLEAEDVLEHEHARTEGRAERQHDGGDERDRRRDRTEQ